MNHPTCGILVRQPEWTKTPCEGQRGAEHRADSTSVLLPVSLITFSILSGFILYKDIYVYGTEYKMDSARLKLCLGARL